MLTAIALCVAAAWLAAYGWHRHLPPVPACDSRSYGPFVDSLQRSQDALQTAVEFAVGAFVVALVALIQAVAVFKRGILRWVLILTFLIFAVPIALALLFLKGLEAPNCF
jgi:hypothetical protein